MAKQMRETNQDTSKFFDEMEEKMEAETSKRRKISKKPGLSQPELLFLQFNPKPVIDGENVCYFSSKGYSQPTGNKSSLNKKSWRPPMKLIESGTTQPKLINNEELLNQHEDTIMVDLKSSTNNIFKTDAQTSEHLQNICLDEKADLTVPLSSLIHSSVTKPQTLIINLAHSKCRTDNNEHVLSQQSTCSGYTIVSDIGNVQVLNRVQEEFVDSKFKQGLSNVENVRFVDEESGSMLIEEDSSSLSSNLPKVPSCLVSDSKVEKNNSTIYELKENDINKQDLENPLNDYVQNDHENENKNSKVENNYCEEILSFANMLTQENVRTNRKTTEPFKEMECNNANTPANLINDFKDCTKNETIDADISSVCNHTENKELNSILILEDRKTNDFCEDIKNNDNDDIQKTANRSLVDSVFENSNSSEGSEPCETNNENIVDDIRETSKKCKTEPISKKTLSGSSVEMGDGSNKETAGVEEDEDAVSKKELPTMLTSSYKSSQKTIKDSQEINSTYNDEHVNSPMIIEDEDKRIEPKDYKVDCNNENKCDIIDDEYSCLMISNSQLMEIEKNFYETPFNKETTTFVTNNKFSTACNGNFRNSKFVSVGTQTDEVNYQNGPLQMPTVLRPNMMMETQKKLRETIQEIQRLNSLLLKIRQEIWPQQSTTEKRVSFPSKDGANSSWRKKP